MHWITIKLKVMAGADILQEQDPSYRYIEFSVRLTDYRLTRYMEASNIKNTNTVKQFPCFWTYGFHFAEMTMFLRRKDHLGNIDNAISLDWFIIL